MGIERPFLSVIIPTYNEQEEIGTLLQNLKGTGNDPDIEILIADGGSSDQTVDIARSQGFVVIECPVKGRAFQMNHAAGYAMGEILYFVHADTLPPDGYKKSIKYALFQGARAGCFRFKFMGGPFLLKINAYCTRFKGLTFRGGDQTLFITHDYFKELKGYDEEFVIMEEYDLIRRIMIEGNFYIIPDYVRVSSRKYQDNNYLKINVANYKAIRMFMKGAAPVEIAHMYHLRLKKLR